MHHPSQFSRSVRGHVVAGLILLALATGCASTRFESDPVAHPLEAEFLQAGHPYYTHLRAGIKSSLLGILPEEDARTVVGAIDARWEEIEGIPSVDSLKSYLQARDLHAVVERIDRTLAQVASETPPGGVVPRAQAAALKLGMLEAVNEFE